MLEMLLLKLLLLSLIWPLGAFMYMIKTGSDINLKNFLVIFWPLILWSSYFFIFVW